MKLEIIELTKNNSRKYIDEIIDIHLNSFSKKHLTADFSRKMLGKYYCDLIKASDLSIISLQKNKEFEDLSVSGFIISGESVSSGVVKFLKANRLYILYVLIQHPALFIEKLKTILTRSNKYINNGINYRLLAIAINTNNQSQGVGSSLLISFERILKARNIKTYGLSVKKSNTRAIGFYMKNNFIVEKNMNNSIYFKKTI